MAGMTLKTHHKILIGLLLLAIAYFGYVFFQYRSEAFKVYDVADKYVWEQPNADLTIVDFNMFSCIHCRNLHPTLIEAIKQDGHVRYISRTITTGDEWENTLVTATYAAAEQGKFTELRNALYDNWPVNNREKLFEIASSLGVDTVKLSRDMSNEDIQAHVEENKSFFLAWFVRATPTLLIGDKIYQPSNPNVTVEELRAYFEQAR